MNDPRTETKQRFRPKGRFSLRTLLTLMVLFAALFGWYSASLSAKKYQQRLEEVESRYSDKLMTLEMVYEGLFEKSEARLYGFKTREPFSGNNFDGLYLVGVNMDSPNSGFSRASLIGANLTDSHLQLKGPGSFQSANLETANLSGAILEVGPSSFQSANFFRANLSNVTISAKGHSLELCSFRYANLSGATIICPDGFSNNDISSADFSDANLVGTQAESLEQCFFGGNPPVYNSQTKFPAGFDAAAAGWLRK